MSSPNRLRGVVAGLAVISLVAALGAGVVSAVVRGGADGGGSGGRAPGDGSAGFDYSGWTTVSGRAGTGEAATYKVPGGAAWEVHDADFTVSYAGKGGRPSASARAGC